MMARLKQINAVIAAAMLVLFIVHGVLGAFQLVGMGAPTVWVIADVLLLLALVHAGIGVALTVSTLRAEKRAGATYPKANKRFWISRITGFLLAVLIVAHVLVFFNANQEAVRVNYFGIVELVIQLLMVAVLAIHVLTNIKPMLISLGVGSPSPRATDIIIAICVILVFLVFAFILYYFRWQA